MDEMSPCKSTAITGIPERTASSTMPLQSTVLPEPVAPKTTICLSNAIGGRTIWDSFREVPSVRVEVLMLVVR